jgi:hypothetical protein
MKKLSIIMILMTFLIGGCSSFNTNLTPEQQQQLLIIPIKVGALNLGVYVGKTKTVADDMAVQDGYLMLRKGQLPIEDLNKALLNLHLDNPVIAANCLILLESMGAVMGPSVGSLNKSILDVSKITPEMWNAAELYYKQGFLIGQSQQK